MPVRICTKWQVYCQRNFVCNCIYFDSSRPSYACLKLQLPYAEEIAEPLLSGTPDPALTSPRTAFASLLLVRIGSCVTVKLKEAGKVVSEENNPT